MQILILCDTNAKKAKNSLELWVLYLHSRTSLPLWAELFYWHDDDFSLSLQISAQTNKMALTKHSAPSPSALPLVY